MPRDRFFCEASLEVDVPERDAEDVRERAADEDWQLFGTLRLPVNSRYAVLDLMALDLVKLQLE